MKYAFLALILFTAAPALAQQEERRGFIGLGIGPSVQLGSFANQSSTNLPGSEPASGYTDTFLNLGYRFRQHIGVAAALAYSEYGTREGDEKDWWKVSTLVVGPMYSLRLGARGAVDLKAMFGKVVMVRVVDEYEIDDGDGVGVDLRVAIRYDVHRRWALFAEGGLQSMPVTFVSGARGDYRALISGFGVAYRPMW